MFLTLGGAPQFTKAQAARLQRLENKLDLILEHLGIAVPESSKGLSAEVRECIARGDKIGAIRAYRAETGMGLADAKAEIDAYMGG